MKSCNQSCVVKEAVAMATAERDETLPECKAVLTHVHRNASLWSDDDGGTEKQHGNWLRVVTSEIRREN